MALWPLVLAFTSFSGQADAPLPMGVRAVWDLGVAWREATPTRERICLNGLWRWRPGGDELPTGGWGWFKVPGCWPGLGDYMQKDCQTVYAHRSWAKQNLGDVTTAWYQRDFSVPSEWTGRRIALSASYVNSLASVYIDGKPAGNITYPAGDLDVTKWASPGTKHTLSIQLVALPLKGVMMSYSDTNAAKQMKATVQRRGLCGDVYLESTPAKERLDQVQIETSVQKGAVTIRASSSNLSPTKRYRLRATIMDHGHTVTTLNSEAFAGSAQLSFTKPWLPGKLWDLNTPQNQFELQLELLDSSNHILDVQSPKPFGFRELWIKGRDFILNGTRVFWSCVPLDNGQISAGLSTYDAAKESLRRLKTFGINMVYTHNYDCNPGSSLAMDEILRAADDVGMLVAFTQPHFGDYDWTASDANAANGYARHAAFFASVAGNHPSVIAYATSHNATGYNEDMNPDLIDGLSDMRDSWALNNVRKAVRAEGIINQIDPSRIVYHHSSGNLGAIYSMNFYLNFVPIQELDDWYEHWSKAGVKPAFMVEYGVPFSWDWSMYRGWYQGQRSFGNAQVPWEYTMAEWNAQFLGDRAYQVSEAEKRNVTWEAEKFRTSKGWFRWDYPFPMGSTNRNFEDQQQVWADYTTDNWRAFRTWGVSGISPWETHGEFWRLKDGVNRGRVELKTDWDQLQRPGYSPDYIDGRFERRDTAYGEADWEPTTGGKSLIRNNGPLLAYIGGKSTAFTDKDHIFRPGSSIEKQIIVINNSRETVVAKCSWVLDLPKAKPAMTVLSIPTGDIQRVPMDFMLPIGLAPGRYRLTAEVEIAGHGTQTDEFWLNVVPPVTPVAPVSELAIYDPLGQTTELLALLGVTGTAIQPGDDLSKVHTLIIGKGALTLDGPGLDLSRVRDGMKVLVFEQTSEVLEQRFGFRVQEYGLRNVFARIPDSPLLTNLNVERLRDWRGASTITPTRRSYVLADKYSGAPSVVRSGLLVPRVWRCGNQGNVASVLIEKPAIGDFTSVLDGGYSLRYSPLLEYREGKGVVFFCQMDVTGRTEHEPAAEQLVANLLNTLTTWRAPLQRSIVYSGEATGKRHLEKSGFKISEFSGALKAGQLLVIGPGDSSAVMSRRAEVSKWLADEGRAVTIGLDGRAIKDTLALDLTTTNKTYINSVFAPAPFGAITAGIGPADVYNRVPREIPVLANDQVIGAAADEHVGLFQLTPWSFDPAVMNSKRVFRHVSVALTRLLGNFGVHAATPLLQRFGSPVKQGEQRWLYSFYLDTPVEEDDPYRFFGW
jgi:hypothetical protein